ncbi:MAG: hypothetical protein V4546_08300 [Bacteroidota bacterium]
MKQRLLFTVTGIMLCFLSFNILAQTAIKAQTPVKSLAKPALRNNYQKRTIDTVKNTDFSLNGQYRFLLSRSRSSYGSKLINPVRLDALWKSVNDTLRKERTAFKNINTKVIEQEKTISSLKAEVSGKENSLSETTAKADEISFLGIPFTKGTYSTIVWSIIIILAISLFVVIARSAKSILEAKHRTQLYDDISAEYQAYKTKSNDQQRKLARELQDERNALEELRTRGK